MAAVKIAIATLPAFQRRRIFISGLECIRQIGGGNLEFVPYIIETDVDGLTVRRECNDTIIMHISALPDAVGKAIMAMGRTVLIDTEGSVTVMQ